MNENNKPVSIIEIAHGKIKEYIDKAMCDIIKNITDPDTMSDKTRKISIDIKFKPTMDRDEIAVTFSVNKDLVNVKDVDTTLTIDYTDDGGKIVMESSGEQISMLDSDSPPNMIKIQALTTTEMEQMKDG